VSQLALGLLDLLEVMLFYRNIVRLLVARPGLVLNITPLYILPELQLNLLILVDWEVGLFFSLRAGLYLWHPLPI
jgi:hypothetical protein